MELRALHFLCKSIKISLGSEASCCIATDAKTVVYDLSRTRANLREEDISAEYYCFINSLSNTKVLLVSRDLNGAADKLAKMGAARSNMVSG